MKVYFKTRVLYRSIKVGIYSVETRGFCQRNAHQLVGRAVTVPRRRYKDAVLKKTKLQSGFKLLVLFPAKIWIEQTSRFKYGAVIITARRLIAIIKPVIGDAIASGNPITASKFSETQYVTVLQECLF